MKITARTLTRLDLVYSIARLPSPEGEAMPAIAAGSEGDGPLVLLRPAEYRPELLAEAPGGFISLCPFPWAGRTFLAASTQFKPVFQAAECRLAAYPLDKGPLPEPLDIGPLPFTHRLAVTTIDGSAFLLASTLCAGKAVRDDWSRPGGIFLAEVPHAPRGGAAWSFRSVSAELSKNHGLEAAVLHGGRRGFLLSAQEGLFFLQTPARAGDDWTREVIAEGEYSDACAFPWDNPGDPQVFSLSPFHGNVLSRHRLTAEGWSREILDDTIDFGHVLWAGALLGSPGLLVGGRGAGKELTLWRHGAGGRFEKHLIDRDVGPSQVTVVDRPGGDAVIFAAAHARGEVIQYIVQA